MRVLMVQTPSAEGISSEKVYPIGIVLLAGLLVRAGHDVEILDMNLFADPYGALKKLLLDARPHAVCLSLRNIDPLGNKSISLVPPFVAAARLCSSISPGTTILAGGTGFSLFPERLMREVPEIRYGIIGEAEQSLPRLLSSLDSPPRLKGLCYRKDGRIRVTPPARDFDMAAYVPPQRGLLDPSPYLGINAYVPAIGIETKRGCPFGCSYCVYPKLQGKRLRLRPPVAVVDEIESLRHEYGVERFHFTDPVLNVPRGHLEGICEEIVRRKLKLRWDGFMRENLLNEKNVALFEKAGCECFSFSPDGLCTQSLRVLGKGMDESDIIDAARLVSKTHVTCVYHFMVNIPGENEETCKAASELLERLYELHAGRRNLGTIVLNNIRILPGTPMEDWARAQGIIGPDTDLLYPTYYNPPPFDALRYRLETLHFCRNVFSWQGIR
jgi:putative variant cofactor biosynthesis B12-binding/radical SAM domain protein 1